MGLLWSGAHRSSTSIHCTSEQTAKNIYHRGDTAGALHFKLTFIKTNCIGGSLAANLSAVVLSHYLSFLVVVNGSVETMATSLRVEFSEISVIKFLCSVETQVCADRLVFADICSIPVL